MLINIWRVGVRRMGPNSFQWCPVTGQGATGTNWSIGSSIWTRGRTSSLWGWWSTGTGSPGRLWILPLWRYSRPAWTRSCAACCRWLCFGLDDPQRSLPTPTILWFCDSGKAREMFSSLVSFSIVVDAMGGHTMGWHASGVWHREGYWHYPAWTGRLPACLEWENKT